MTPAVSSSPAAAPKSSKPTPPRPFKDIALLEKIKYVLSKLPVPQLAYTPEGWNPTWVEHANTEAFRKIPVCEDGLLYPWQKIGIRTLTAMRFAVFTLAVTIIVGAIILLIPHLAGSAFAGFMAVCTTLSLTMLAEALVAGLYHLAFLVKAPHEQNFGFAEKTKTKALESVENNTNVGALGAQERSRQKTPAAEGEEQEEPLAQNDPEPTHFEHPDAQHNNMKKQLIEAQKISQSEDFKWATKQLCNETIKQTNELNPAKLATPLDHLEDPESTHIEVAQASSFQMAQHLRRKNLNPAVLNMANSVRPGGGQEGMLCAQSNLHEALTHANKKGLYPIDPFGVIVAPKVTFFKDDQHKKIDETFEADVISATAYDCREGGNAPATNEEYEAKTMRKILAMLRAAVLNNNDSVVLSAFGCGAFGNDPEFISSVFSRIFEGIEFQGRFKAVIFAIPEADGSPNLAAFQTAFPAPEAPNQVEP